MSLWPRCSRRSRLAPSTNNTRSNKGDRPRGRSPFLLCKKVRIVGDVSSVEVLVNDGALVFSTRIYPATYGVSVDAAGANVTYHALNI